MRKALLLSVGLSIAGIGGACSSTSGNSGFDNPPPDGGSPTHGNEAGDGTMTLPMSDGSPMFMGEGGMHDTSNVMSSTTVYAHSDTALFSMDPMTMAVTQVGVFAGLPDAAYQAVTDLAVNAAGDVYVCTESVVYKASLPSTPSATAPVPLTTVATIAAAPKTYFYALAFTPAGVLGSGEMLVGGDNNGELWSIDPMSGVTQDLGNFGPDKGNSGNYYGVSGDIVFYMDAMNNPTGLATIRSCGVQSNKTVCYPTSEASDFLAGIDMTALATAYTSKVKATSLLKGIYGGSAMSAGPGTGLQKIFGLGAWEGNVYGFTRADNTMANMQPPKFVLIDTMSGAATVVNSMFSFTDGWSGAGVSTTVTVTIMPPPPPPM